MRTRSSVATVGTRNNPNATIARASNRTSNLRKRRLRTGGERWNERHQVEICHDVKNHQAPAQSAGDLALDRKRHEQKPAICPAEAHATAVTARFSLAMSHSYAVGRGYEHVKCYNEVNSRNMHHRFKKRPRNNGYVQNNHSAYMTIASAMTK